LRTRKGRSPLAADADLVIWNPDASFKVDPAQLHHRHKTNTLCGARAYGYSPNPTFLRGVKIYERGKFCNRNPLGKCSSEGKTMKDFTQLADLASERLGGRVLDANDDFFASKEKSPEGIQSHFSSKEDIPSRGKWMDGWETRRRRTPGHDWCVLRLGPSGCDSRASSWDHQLFHRQTIRSDFLLEGCDLGERNPYKQRKKAGCALKKTKWIGNLPGNFIEG